MNSRKMWDFWASRYDDLWVQHISLKPTRTLVCRHIADLAISATPLKILDMGCGTGQQYEDLAATLGSDHFSYTGVDGSREMILAAHKKYPQATFIESDVARFTSPQASFDVIICSHSFPYYDAAETTLCNLAGLLKPQGVFLLSQACVNTWYDAMVLKVVSFTTSTARYRSCRRMEELGAPLFQRRTATRISEISFMPSLYLFKWVK